MVTTLRTKTDQCYRLTSTSESLSAAFVNSISRRPSTAIAGVTFLSTQGRPAGAGDILAGNSAGETCVQALRTMVHQEARRSCVELICVRFSTNKKLA